MQLEEGLKSVASLYSTRGYVKAHPELHAQMDDGDNTVAYTIDVREGAQYRMGEVELEGLDDKVKARVREDWTLKQGDLTTQATLRDSSTTAGKTFRKRSIGI